MYALPGSDRYVSTVISSTNFSAVIGSLKRKPCISSQPVLIRNSSCSSVSTPSATTFIFMICAIEITETIAMADVERTAAPALKGLISPICIIIEKAIFHLITPHATLPPPPPSGAGSSL